MPFLHALLNCTYINDFNDILEYIYFSWQNYNTNDQLVKNGSNHSDLNKLASKTSFGIILAGYKYGVFFHFIFINQIL